ncbi:Uncharacterised protein [Escherichia coli]|uniref:hypothetical protein n=1 Tax=Escherichia coli TaxID=562 RepID=UPI000DA5323B|nr:hypothetical protein [Escherichia coli]SQS28196.1 Uncharacterised protein [Escherichia coli]
MTTICGNVTTSDMSACWANYKNSGDVNNVNRDMRNLWLKIKDWFTGQNSNDIIQAFIANRQNALVCLLNPQCNRDELTTFQSSFTALYKAVSQNLRSGVQCSLSKVDMPDSKYNEIRMQYPGKALCVLKLPDGTELGYTLLPNEQAEILCSIDEQISSGSIDAKMQYTVFCSVADLLTQAETLQSTDINSCTSELISSFGVACMHVIESMTAANIHSGSSCVYDATECYEFTGQNSNDIIRAFIANRQNALECLNPQCNSDELSAFQSSFTALYKAVSQNLRSGVQCSLSKVDMTDSKYNAIQMQYPGKALCVLKLPDGTALGYTLLPNEQAEILCSIDEQISSGSIDAKMQYTVFCSVADLLTQAETLQSTNSETCTTECISSFQLACVRFFQSLSAANIHSGSSCVYDATECHNGRFGRVTMKFNDTTIVDIGLRCADNDPEFVLSNTVTDDSSQIFYALRNDSRNMPMPDDLSSYFRIQRRSNGQLDLPAARRNRGRVVLDQYQQKLEYDLLDNNINNTAFVLAHLTLIDRFFPNPTSNNNKYSSDFQTHGQIMGIISEIEQDDFNAAEYMAENWVSFTPYGHNSNACVRMGDNGALPTMDNLSPLVQRAVENTRTELANGDIQTEKQHHENALRDAALQRLVELDPTGGLTTKYENYPIEGVLLEDKTPWVLFDKTGFSELKYISLCLLASRQEN